VKQTALKGTYRAIIEGIGPTWYQGGTASKELLEIGWRTNVFSWINAVLNIQVGFLVHTRQSPKVWSFVESVLARTVNAAVIGIKISE